MEWLARNSSRLACETSPLGTRTALPSWIAPVDPYNPVSAPVGSHVPATIERRTRSTTVPPPLPDTTGEPRASTDGDASLQAESAGASAELTQLRDALTRARDEAEGLRRRIGHLTEALGRVRGSVIEQSEPELVRLALAVAERVVREHVRVEPATMIRWVREATATLAGADSMVIALAADIADALDPAAWATAGEHAQLIVDATLPPGGCEVRTAASVLSTGIDDRIEVVRDELGIDGQ